MKNQYPKLLVITILLVISAVFSACGDDDTTTNPTDPPGTVLYSADSMSVWISSPNGQSSDSVSYSFSTATAIKVDFTLQSNVDSTHALGYYFVFTNSTPAVVYEPNLFVPVDLPISESYILDPLSTYISFSIRLIVTSGAIPYYLRLKDIKVTKL